jgi:hypothetical protein
MRARKERAAGNMRKRRGKEDRAAGNMRERT